ncbi:MAG: amidohydrolase [Chloroflexi bacterium]|nr:amidohydrolase [Chloroflexota bacterium]
MPNNDTPIIDCQVHAYEANTPENPWVGELTGPPEVTGEQMVEAMDEVGVDGALLISPYRIYGYDGSYALAMGAKFPDRFGLIRPFDPLSETVGAEVEEWTANPGVVGARIVLRYVEIEADHPGLDQVMEAGAAADIPVNVLCTSKVPLFREIARRHPNTQLVIDHLGLTQPHEPPPPDEPWAELDEVLTLAEFDHVAIKVSGACTLAHEPFPYPDIWQPLSRVFEAFGFDRCLWGTDWTRAVNLLTYWQGVEAFRVTDQLSDAERAALMGGSLERIYGWSPGAAAAGG